MSKSVDKTPYQLFVEANWNLIECYEKVKAAQGDSPKPDSSLLNSCNTHKDTIRGIL